MANTHIWIQGLNGVHYKYMSHSMILSVAGSGTNWSAILKEQVGDCDIILSNLKEGMKGHILLYKSNDLALSKRIIKACNDKLNARKMLMQELHAIRNIPGVSKEVAKLESQLSSFHNWEINLADFV